ncbi:MAG: radical SAM protein [Candidatus Baldrarchaeia archaeon]
MSRILEINVVRKNWLKVPFKMAIVYPNVYRVGMTSLAVHIVYSLANMRNDVLCERAFLPYTEPLIVNSLESHQSLKNFDLVAFSLQYETDYINMLRILRSSGIPLKSEERGENDPIIAAGGPCVWENPEPIAEFVDVFAIGDAEILLDDLLNACTYYHKEDALRELSEMEGFYVPKFSSGVIRRRIATNLDDYPYPVAQIIPQVEEDSKFCPIFGKSFLLEVSRGCVRGCRFCLIGFQNRPFRTRSLGRIRELIEVGIDATGVRNVVLIGAAVFDHRNFKDICWEVVNRGYGLSVPSLRVDSFDEDIALALSEGGQRTVTFAPEAGTYRLREFINKPFTEEQILQACSVARVCGIKNVKLYFMVGLPSETMDDIVEIAKLVEKVKKLGFPPDAVRVSVTPFIPKPHTPFQWMPQMPLRELRRRIERLRRELSLVGIRNFEFVDPRWAKIQAALSLGDRRLGKLLELIATRDVDWRSGQKITGIDLSEYTDRPRDPDSPLPWDHIDVGIPKTLLLREFERACEFLKESSPEK